jgi:hypothetical protein
MGVKPSKLISASVTQAPARSKIPKTPQSVPNPQASHEAESQLLQNLKQIGQVKADSQAWLREVGIGKRQRHS